VPDELVVGPDGTERRKHRLIVQGAACQLLLAEDEELLITSGARTGKSVSALVKANWMLRSNPGMRALFMRQTRKSLTETILPAWEELVLWPTHPAIHGRAKRAHRDDYIYPNEARVVLGSADHIDRILSAEYDLIIFFQAEETTIEVWEKLVTRLSHDHMRHPATGNKYHQILGDVNPTIPTHFLLGRVKRGFMRRINYRLEDNPAMYDPEKREYTERGQGVVRRLDRLTGVRRLRLRDHQWATAEGIVWETYDPEAHHIYAELDWSDRHRRWQLQAPSLSERPIVMEWFGCSVDFGFVHPCALQVWGFDKDQRAFLVAEVLHSRKKIQWLATWAQKLYQRFKFRIGVTDHSVAERMVLNQYVGEVGGQDEILDEKTGAVVMPGLFQPWGKDRGESGEKAGIDLVRDGFDQNRIFIVRDALVHPPDPELLEAYQPTCLAEEIAGYTYPEDPEDPNKPKKESPIKVRDDACDAARGMIHWAFGKNLVKKPKKPEYPADSYAGALFGGKWDEILKGKVKPGRSGIKRRRRR
jgi:phage terminase large subunit